MGWRGIGEVRGRVGEVCGQVYNADVPSALY